MLIVPTQFQKIIGLSEVAIEHKTLDGLLKCLCGEFPDLNGRLFDKDGKVNKFINIYVNGEDIRFLNGVATNIESTDEITMIPAVAGG